MNYKEIYRFWLEDEYFDAETKAELAAIAGDDKEIEDALSKISTTLEDESNSEEILRKALTCLSM